MIEGSTSPPRLGFESEETTVSGSEEEQTADEAGLVLFLFCPSQIASFSLPRSGTLIIGRSRDSEIPIDDPSVSRAHARLILEPREAGRPVSITIEDLGSSNGTRVEGRALKPGERAKVEKAQAIQVGLGCLLTIHPAPVAPAARSIWSYGHLRERVLQEVRAAVSFTLLRVATRGQAGIVDVLLAGLEAEDLVAVSTSGDCDVLSIGPGRAEEKLQAIHRLLADRGFACRIGAAQHPEHGSTLEALVAHAVDHATDERDDSAPKARIQITVVEDPQMKELHQLADRIADSEINVLIHGETGAGKEVLARSIHMHSPRAQGPFIPLNCGAIAPTLLESELFGHMKGAFTGAVSTRPGLLEAAERGTVFLDEVGEMPLDMQVKMLRVIEERVVWRIGGREPIAIDTRIICATHRDLATLAEEGAFRTDLYYRLNGITLRIPPLRERRGEIAPLARKFLQDAARSAGHPRVPPISRPALEALEAAEWPGNIRQLKNAIECAFVLAGGGVILKEHLPPLERPPKLAFTRNPMGVSGSTLVDAPLMDIDWREDSDTERSFSIERSSSAEYTSSSEISTSDRPPPQGRPGTPLATELGDIEKRRILEALALCGGNQTRTAEMLGMSRKTLLARLDAYDVHRPRKGRSKS